MAPAPAVLGFDTSAAHCGAVLIRGGEVLAEAHEEMGRGQAERLFPMLQEVLAAGGLGWGDLAGIGVGTGPGNFTGVRISVSAARGLALALGVPAIGVTLFEALALAAPRPALACLSAPRGQVYTQLFTAEGIGAPGIATPEAAAAALSDATTAGALTCVGAAAVQMAGLLGARSAPAVHAPAAAIARIAAGRLHAPGERPRPVYLRPADAAPPREAAPAILP